MNAIALGARPAVADAAAFGPRGSRGSFASLDPFAARGDRSRDPHALATEAARTLVREAFVRPVFEELHKGSLAAGPFRPGTAERRFRPMLDGMLADRIVERSDFALVRTIEDRFERAIARREGGA